MIRKIFEKYNENGLIGVIIPLITRMPGVRALCVYHVYRLPFSRLPKESAPIEKLNICVLHDDTKIDDLVKIQNKPEIFRDRFKLNHFCLLAYVNGDPAAYLWGQQGPKHYEQYYGFEIPISDDQAYYYDSHTSPKWRKRGLLRYLIERNIHYCKITLHKNELIAIVEITNKVSQKSHEKIGFIKENLMIFINIAGKSFQFKLYPFK